MESANNTNELQTALKIQEDIQGFLKNLIEALNNILDASVLTRLKEQLMSVEQKIATLVAMIRSTVVKVITSTHNRGNNSTSPEIETMPSGVHPKIFAAYQQEFKDKNLFQIYALYQKLKTLPATYFLTQGSINQKQLEENIKTSTIGWFLTAKNIKTHVHSLNQLKNQILGKSHPWLQKLRFDGSKKQQKVLNNTWINLKPWAKIIFEAWENIHQQEAH